MHRTRASGLRLLSVAARSSFGSFLETNRTIAELYFRLVHDFMFPVEIIEQKIFLIRGQKVMSDRDLANYMRCRRRGSTSRFTEISSDFPLISCFDLRLMRTVF